MDCAASAWPVGSLRERMLVVASSCGGRRAAFFQIDAEYRRQVLPFKFPGESTGTAAGRLCLSNHSNAFRVPKQEQQFRRACPAGHRPYITAATCLHIDAASGNCNSSDFVAASGTALHRGVSLFPSPPLESHLATFHTEATCPRNSDDWRSSARSRLHAISTL